MNMDVSKDAQLNVSVGLVALMLLVGAAGCAPEFEAANCSDDSDCFEDEVCRSGSCQVGQRSQGDVGADGGEAGTQDTGRADAGPEAGEVAAVILTPLEPRVAVGKSAPLQATVLGGGGQALDGVAVEWSSGDESVVTVGENGTVTGQKTGTATVRATAGGVEASVDVEVVDVQVEEVEIMPAITSLQVGKTLEMTAVVRDETGAKLEGRMIEWSSDDEGVATVDASGVVTAEQPGQVRIEATVEGETGAARLQIVRRPLGGVAVRPETPSLKLGEQVQLEAMPLDDEGMDLCGQAPCGRTVVWTSGAPSVAKVDTDGLVTAQGKGTALIFASLGGVRGSTTVEVGMPEVQSVDVAPTMTTLNVGEVTLVEATVTAKSGSTVKDVAVNWSSDDTAIAEVQSGVVEAKGLGTATITAEVGGKSADVSVEVVPGPPQTVKMVPSSTTIQMGQSVLFSPTLEDANGKALSGRMWDYYSTDPGVATVNGSGKLTTVGGGTMKVVAIDRGTGLAGTADVTVDVPNRAPTAEAGPAQTVEVGATATLDASMSTDPDGTSGLSYQWTLTQSPSGAQAMLVDPATKTAELVPDVAGDYIVELSVDDGMASDTDTVTITANAAPTAKITPVGTVKTGASVTLEGAMSSDPEGKALSYDWSFASNGTPGGSTATIQAPRSQNTRFTPDVKGDYDVQLTVTDPAGATATASMTVTAVDNLAPTASIAVNNTPISVGDTVQLDGTGSSDPEDGSPASYAWSFVTRPSGSTASFSDATAAQPTFPADAQGSFEVKLEVTDSGGKTASTTQTVTVNP